MPELFIHYLAVRANGPMRSAYREAKNDNTTQVISRGRRCVLACQPQRKFLGQAKGRGRNLRLVDPRFAFTTSLMFRQVDLPGGKTLQEMVTCPACKNSAVYKEDEAQQRKMWETPAPQSPGEAQTAARPPQGV